MKQKIVIAGLALVVLGAGVFISLRKTQDSSPQQRQMSALKELRESGVITAQEYDSKVQALRTSAPAASGASKDKIAALQELRDSGVITAQEYESKVQAVQASPRPVSTSLAPTITQPVHFIETASGTGTADAAASTSSGTRKEFIRDPSLDMNANEVNVPAKWLFRGVFIQRGNCLTTPSVVFRATSPDGLTFVEQMPVLGWFWGTGPSGQSDCLPLKQAMGAQEFLKYISATLKVEYLADEPVPPNVLAKAQKAVADSQAIYAPKYAAIRAAPPKETLQLARATVRYRNGTFVMKGMLSATVDCNETQGQMPSTLVGRPPRIQPGQPWTLDRCYAYIQFISAPENQYQATVSMLDSIDIGPTEIPAWTKAWLDRSGRQTAQAIDQMNKDAAAQRTASARQFAHDQGVRQQMHEEFLSTMQRGTDMSMNRAAQIANSNHTIASDWVDYSLDQQTVRDPNTGQVTKVSSSNSYTWLDNSGKVSYQTNDVNADPNGVLKGNWTRQQQVHGDGTNK